MKDKHALQPGTILDRYKIIHVLGEGGFGITYLAEDIQLGLQVVIKEYFPNEFAIRNFDSSIIAKTDSEDHFTKGLQRFKEEAKTLIQFKHPSIVKILGYFEANNTAYFVMKYEGGIDLDKYMKQNHPPLSQDEILEMMMPILEGLKEVHKYNYLHRDIKPANILLRENASPVLIDFGASKIALGEVSKSITTILTAGYAPPEQYSSDVKRQGVFTDLYSLAAVMYKMITGVVPPDAQTRSYALLSDKKDPYLPLIDKNLSNYDTYFLSAIDNALLMEAKKRPQSVQQFQENILGEVVAPSSQPTQVIDNVDNNGYTPSSMFSFEGRINRLRYWLYSLIPIAIILGASALVAVASKNAGGGESFFSIVLIVSFIVAIWISFALQVKRWHDLDQSGWWALIGMIPYVNIIVLIMLGFVKGTVGANRFGVDPLSISVNDAVIHQERFNKVVNIEPSNRINNYSVTLLGIGHNIPPIVLASNSEVIVGRSNSADIKINNKYVSERHLSLSLDNKGRVQVRDLSSSNGTYIDGSKLSPNIFYEFKPGKKLLIASEDVVYTL